MKKFIYFLLFQLLFVATSHSQSSITYNAGTSIEIDVGADVCADAININGTFSGSGTICNGVLPVTISTFNSSVSRNNVSLNWVTEIETNNSGFEVQRKKTTESVWKASGFVKGNGTTHQPKGYIFVDKNLTKAVYQYRLKQIDYNNNFEYYSLAANVTISGPKDFSVTQNYPNPSNPKSKIDYQIPFDSKVSIKVYDIIGKEVVTLVNEFKTADYYSIEFDGTNLASGVYIYRIIAENNSQKFTKSMKLVLLK
jgi:hypothetical protein